MKEAAEAMGVSERWAYDLHTKDQAAVDEIRALIRPLVKTNVRAAKQIALDNYEAELEASLGTFIDAIKRAAESDDPKTALAGAIEGMNRLVGKPKSKLELSGGLKNTFALDPETIQVLKNITMLSGPLYQRARQIQAPIDVTAG